jgi:protein-tyrosine-phosphatase
VAFVCSQNSARSQLAESYWRTISDIPVVSGGTHPARRVHPRAVTVGRRHGLDLTRARPRLATDVLSGNELVIAVCDRAYEDLDSRPLHWSVPDPALAGNVDAFEGAYHDITGRITRLTASFEGEES